MWKNIPADAKERFGVEGWQRKITQNHPRYWSTNAQEYGMFTTPTVRWRLEQEATPQKPNAASHPWETTNSHYGGRFEQLNKTTYRQHVTSMAAAPSKNNRYQRSRYNPHPGIRLERIPGLRAKDDYVTSNQSLVTSPPLMPKRNRVQLRPVKQPSIHEKFLRTRYIVPWKVSYKG